ncbi:MAG: hypothetical protein FWE47_01310 [Oscillospiraceae bacterium]|nr:hypothetical protein [Oscillospiraceae bacterium]
MRTRNRTYTIVAVLALLLVTGVVYAAASGALHFGDNMMHNGMDNKKAHLKFVEEKIVNKVDNEKINVTENGKKLDFTVHLKKGETRHINFKIENSGTENAVLENLIIPSLEPGITVAWPELRDVAVTKNGKMPVASEYKIAVTLDAAHAQESKEVTLSAKLNYKEHNGKMDKNNGKMDKNQER